jgi:hypothetical protein
MDLELPELPPPARTHPGERLVGAIDVPELPGLDTGRAQQVGAVSVEDIPGFQESSMFAAMTPAHVTTQAVAGLETTAQAKVGDVFAAPQPSGLFHSDFMKAPEGVPTQQIDGIEGHPASGTRTAKAAPAKGKGKKGGVELEKVVCRCGEPHRLSHCPSCGTIHPDLRDA